jgi:hypothetical protein
MASRDVRKAMYCGNRAVGLRSDAGELAAEERRGVGYCSQGCVARQTLFLRTFVARDCAQGATVRDNLRHASCDALAHRDQIKA